MLAAGREHFGRVAMIYALKFICREDLEKIVAVPGLLAAQKGGWAASFRSGNS